MNRTFISIATAVTLLASQASQARDHSDYLFEQATARAAASVSKTRAEVKAELNEAKASGHVAHGDRDPAPAFSNPSALNRVDVQREAIEANKSRSSVYQERG